MKVNFQAGNLLTNLKMRDLKFSQLYWWRTHTAWIWRRVEYQSKTTQILKKEAASCSETLVTTYQLTEILMFKISEYSFCLEEGYCCRYAQLTARLQLIPSSRLSGFINLLPHIPSRSVKERLYFISPYTSVCHIKATLYSTVLLPYNYLLFYTPWRTTLDHVSPFSSGLGLSTE